MYSNLLNFLRLPLHLIFLSNGKTKRPPELVHRRNFMTWGFTIIADTVADLTFNSYSQLANDCEYGSIRGTVFQG